MNEKQNWLTLVVGLPRSGKSTWVERHKDDAVVISSDWIREHVLGESYSYAESANAIVWAMMDCALRIVLGQGKDAILDGTNLTKFTRQFYAQIARECGAKVRIMWVNTSLEECLERNESAKDHKLPSVKLSSMAEKMQAPTQDEYDELCCMFPCFEEIKP